MKYTITKLDGRYSYREDFEFYIGFTSSMPRDRGPISFNNAMIWFTNNYGWSAEIRQWCHIKQWTHTGTKLKPIVAKAQQLGYFQNVQGLLLDPSSHCNPHWSWTNSYHDLRIYLASEQELTFWQLAHPVDQKR